MKESSLNSRVVIIPHPAMSAAQCELTCLRNGLALAHIGRGRLMLVQTSRPAQTMLRIAPRADPEPEAA